MFNFFKVALKSVLRSRNRYESHRFDGAGAATLCSSDSFDLESTCDAQYDKISTMALKYTVVY
jgi:hypothetical protein